jgi:hypothetical protein
MLGIMLVAYELHKRLEVLRKGAKNEEQEGIVSNTK